jgi:hypothetical protein
MEHDKNIQVSYLPNGRTGKKSEDTIETCRHYNDSFGKEVPIGMSDSMNRCSY